MSDMKEKLEQTIQELKTRRDELKLQMHLGAADAKDEYDKASAQLDKILAEYAPVSDAVGESANKVWESLSKVGAEVKDSYDRVASSLKK